MSIPAANELHAFPFFSAKSGPFDEGPSCSACITSGFQFFSARFGPFVRNEFGNTGNFFAFFP